MSEKHIESQNQTKIETQKQIEIESKKQYEILRKSLTEKNKLEILSNFNNLLENISNIFLYEIKEPQNLNEIFKIVNNQKNITEIIEDFYEYLQNENFEIQIANEFIDKLEYACNKMNDSILENKEVVCEENKGL